SKTFFKRWYTPQYATVIVVGDVDEQKTLDWVKQYWGNWKATDFKVEIPEEKPQAAQLYEHLQFSKSPNTYLAMAFRGPALDEEQKNKPALDLMSEAYFSESSELHKDLVIDRQLVQSQFAYFPDRKDPQLLYILAQLKKPEYAEQVKQAYVDTLIKARTELVDETRLNNIKSNGKYSFAQTLNSTSSIASTLASYVHYERDPEFLNRLYATYATITPEDIRTFTNKYFVDSNLTMMTMSPLAELEGFDPLVSLDKAVAEVAATPTAEMTVTNETKDVKQSEDSMETMVTTGTPANVATLFDKTSSDLIDITWWFKTGAIQDPEGKKGLATLTSAMISNAGSKSRTYTEIQQALYPLAAGFGSRVDKEMMVFRGNVHKDNLSDWYGLVSEQLLNPGWREDDFQRVKDQLINSIENSLKSSNDEELGKEVLYEALYTNHSYGHLSTGHVDDIQALTMDDVKAFYASQLTQANLTVAMAGNYPESFKDRLLVDLASLPEGKASDTDIADAPELKGRHATIVEKETLSTAVSFGFPIDVKRGDDDWIGLWLVRSWLGEHRNSNSFLYQRIRQERGMNYGDYAYIEYFPGGMFTSKPATNVPRSEQIFQVWIRPLRTITDAHFATRTAMWEMEKLIENGLTEEQFEATRNFLKNYAPQLVNSQGRILGYTVDSAFYGTDDFVGYVRNGLQELTLEKVNAIIKKHLQLENMHYVFITKDAEELKQKLATDAESPMVYNSAKSEEILAEDKIISVYPLAIKEDNIKVVPIKDVFK
ncbi:MAG: insulinase family protein, partial [Gammaproteobacteria bacterium]|nr:insulinase family protein [Gammaproteobacteria bacterium]